MVSDYLLDWAGLSVDRSPAYIVGWRENSPVAVAQFVTRVWAWHALLTRHTGRNFALYLNDSIEFGAALLGAWQAGKTIWLAADTLDASCASLRKSVDAFLGEFPASLSSLRPELHDGASGGTANKLDPNMIALVVHTSGSTGVPQAISKRLAQLANEVSTLETIFGRVLGDAAIAATVSHHHIYGLLFRVLWPLSVGRAIYANSLVFPEQLVATLAKRRCILVTSPAHLKRLPDHLSWSKVQPNLRAVFSSGGPLELDVAQATGNLLGQIPVEVYGSSETGGIAWRQRILSADEFSDESWRPFPNVSWRVSQSDNLLEVRSSHLENADWLRLADRAQATGPERFLLLGRSDRIVKIEEKRISLNMIEARLATSDLVDGVRVLLCDTMPGDRQRLAAFIVASSAGRAILTNSGKLVLSRLLSSTLSGVVDAIALPRRWRYLDRMPVNDQGKTTHAQLLAMLQTQSAQRPCMPHRHLLEREENRILLELIAPSSLRYFDGHFKDAPVLAGVVQIDWAIAYGRQYFSLLPQFYAVQALKFPNVIRPDRPIRLELLHDVAKGSLNFRYFSEIGPHASGRILFRADEALH